MKKPSQRTWIIVGLSAAAVIAAGAFALSQLPAPTAGLAGADSSASHSSSPSSSSSTSGSTSKQGSNAPSTPGARSTPPAAGKRYTTEVMPAKPAAKPALPQSTALPYPVSAPLPKSSSAKGELVDGYPSKVLPQAPGSSVTASSVASQSGHLQVTLTATSKQQVTDLISFYRSALSKYGMYDSAAPALSGSTSVVFERDGNAVTLTVTPSDGGTTYALYGAFTAKG